MTAAAFSACFADWKLIRGRKVVQLVFEVPLEKADEAYQVVGGMPDPSTSKWFAIAALTEEVQQPRPQNPANPAVDGASPQCPSCEGTEKWHATGCPLAHKKSWDEILPSQQAGILCNEPLFWNFLTKRNGKPIECVSEAATWVRQYCKVNTRADLTNQSPAALAKWRELVVDYRLWERAVV